MCLYSKNNNTDKKCLSLKTMILHEKYDTSHNICGEHVGLI